MRFDSRLRLQLASLAAVLLISSCNEPMKVVQDPPCTSCAATQDELIQSLAKAYRERDIDIFTNLFPNTADQAPYFFFLNEPVNGVSNWDLTEEIRIHRRMFKPEDPLPGETPVHNGLWLVSITIILSRKESNWVERTDLYKSDTNPEGLDAVKWKATEAEFHADVLWETQGETDYRVDGRHNFIVIEDRAKAAGDARKYLIYRWEDLSGFLPLIQNAVTSAEASSWSSVKSLYSH